MSTTAEPTIDTGTHWSGASSDSPWITLARELAPQLEEHAARHDETGTFVHEGFELLHDHRLLSLMVPRELGGGGASHADACAVLAELARGCPATSLSYSMHSHLVAAQVWRHKRGMPAPVLERVAEEQICLISTGASDWLTSSGCAERVDGGFVVSASKMPASGAPAGDVLVTSVRWEDTPDGPQIIHCSIPFSHANVSIIETWDTMGMRGTGSHTVVIDEVFVPDAAVALIRPADEWHPVWATVLGVAMPLIMSTYVGVAELAAQRAVTLAARRSERPETVAQIGRMHNRLTAARDAVGAMISSSDDMRFDNTVDHADVTLRRKTNAAEACIDTVRLALELSGGPAYSRGGGIERLFRDVHGALYHPLPTAQQEMFTGQHVR